MAKEKMVRVKYVGKKPHAIDNVASSGKTWTGHGDVQVVTEAQAEKLCKFPDQWELVKGGEVTNDEQAEVALNELKALGASPDIATPSADVATAARAVQAAVATKAKGKGGPKVKAADTSDFKD